MTAALNIAGGIAALALICWWAWRAGLLARGVDRQEDRFAADARVEEIRDSQRAALGGEIQVRATDFGEMK